MPGDVSGLIARALGQEVRSLRGLNGGCVGEVFEVELTDGRKVVAKVDGEPEGRLHIEGKMLRYLHSHKALPVPEVLYASPQLLLMTWADGISSFSEPAERNAAALLAALHGVTAPKYGFDESTLIGGLHQPNPWTDRWVDFFREHRLLHMAEAAAREGRMDHGMVRRLEAFAGRLEDFLQEPERPALLHGDVWTTNVLAANGRVTAFLDPAVYYGHPEIELAFITLFNTFGNAFFARYQELRPILSGFFETRRDIYNLYPLLVHVRLFGGGYLAGVERTLGRCGF